MRSSQAIITALKCRLAQLRQPPHTDRKRALLIELQAILDWIRRTKPRG